MRSRVFGLQRNIVADSITITSMHTCKVLIIHCMDFRLMEPVFSHLKERGLVGAYDEVSLAGAVKSIVDDPIPGLTAETVLADVDVHFSAV